MILRIAETLPNGVEWTLIELGHEARVAWAVEGGLSHIQITEHMRGQDGSICNTNVRSIPCFAAWVGHEGDWIPLPSEQSVYAQVVNVYNNVGQVEG